MTNSAFTRPASRRTFLGLAGAALTTSALAACSSSGSGGSSEPLKFWQMPMGNTEFNSLDKQIAQAYKPKAGGATVSYQLVQWNNFVQTFASAVASKNGPAVSSGGGTQAFLYADQGEIAYADALVEQWKKSGLYDDFLPGTIDALKTPDGHQAAIPQNIDMIVFWYSPKLLEEAGVAVPTDWQSFSDAAAALKKQGVYALGTGSGAGNFQGAQLLVSWMINNGGGLFNEAQEPDCVTDVNVEAIDFIVEMVKKGYADPRSVQYTNQNVADQWKAGKFGMGFDVINLKGRAGAQFDGVVGSPLKSPSGSTGTLEFINNIMMWKNTPSQKDSEAFMTYYYEHSAKLWTEGTMQALPPLKSIASSKEFQADPNHGKVIDEWQPIAKTYAAPGKAMSKVVTTVDGTQPMTVFAQTVLGGKVTARSALTTLQDTLAGAVANL